MPNEMKDWKKKAWAAEELKKILREYGARQRKFIKYKPTDKELRQAIEFYKFLLDDVDRKDETALKLYSIIKKVSDNTEEQIKFFGFMGELFEKYPSGEVYRKDLLDIAEKWGVLDYIVTDIVAFLNIKMQ